MTEQEACLECALSIKLNATAKKCLPERVAVGTQYTRQSQANCCCKEEAVKGKERKQNPISKLTQTQAHTQLNRQTNAVEVTSFSINKTLFLYSTHHRQT